LAVLGEGVEGEVDEEEVFPFVTDDGEGLDFGEVYVGSGEEGEDFGEAACFVGEFETKGGFVEVDLGGGDFFVLEDEEAGEVAGVGFDAFV